jgi:hypothetical protein
MTILHCCDHCKTPVELNGDVPRLVLCASCQQHFTTPDCHVCGDPAVHVVEDSDDASGYRGEIGLCQQHWAERR